MYLTLVELLERKVKLVLPSLLLFEIFGQDKDRV